MHRSFYSWLMTQRKSHQADEVQEFANRAFFDQSFPKQSQSFDEVSKYLEENGLYLQNMSIFDTAWHQYQESEG